MDDKQLEEIQQSRNLTAPRVSLGDLEGNILAEYSFMLDKAVAGAPVMPGMEVYTVVVLVLKNGFIVTGESAPASPQNFDADLGRKIARTKAIDKVWPLMGYALKQRLYDAPPTAIAA